MRLVRGTDILVREASISAAAESLGAMKLELGGKIGRDAIAPAACQAVALRRMVIVRLRL